MAIVMISRTQPRESPMNAVISKITKKHWVGPTIMGDAPPPPGSGAINRATRRSALT
jgi:hypothetical protein